MQRNRFIDILKGILIIFVIVSHFPFGIAVEQQYLFPFWIAMAVPCFMVISGYVSGLSYRKKGVINFAEAYKPMVMVQKVLRFVIPYTIAFVAQWIVFRIFRVYTVGVRTYGILALFFDYLRGGKGQGSYYFPIMIQFLLVFPIVYLCIRKYKLRGLMYCFGANVIFEVLKTAYGMSDMEYRLLVFRYLFLFAAGCYFALEDQKPGRKEKLLAGVCIVTGLFFTYLFSYTAYSPKILTYWSTTSFLPCLFVVPVMGVLLSRVKVKFPVLEIIGKASFNIFLVQMIYYNFADRIYQIIPNRGAQLAFNIINCVVAGVIFYYLESKLSKRIIKWLCKPENKLTKKFF